jgi:hypothetical protein
MAIETKETIEEVKKSNSYLLRKGIVKVGSFFRYEIKRDEKGVEVTDWSVTRYYYKDGHTEESLNGCTIHIAKEVLKKVNKIMGEK